jgi:cytochrome c oxidase cbb3-type subunit 4
MPWLPTCNNWARCCKPNARRRAAAMDINDLRGLSTAFLMVAFIGLCCWAYSGKRKQAFDDAANLPFADEPQKQREDAKHE